MSLKEYARKRTFSRTPEPPPAEKEVSAASSPKPVFVVQRHHARRLHYDFRLELDGTLKSWAIPKGPTLDPALKRLAVHVEDHPLDYGGFEGNIPAGQYGGGSVMVWDRGTYEVLGKDPPQAQYARGDFKFRLHGEKLRGEFALVRTKARTKALTKGRGDNQWLLIKKKDAAAVPGWDPEDHPRSALSGRSQEEIAKESSADPSRERKLAGQSSTPHAMTPHSRTLHSGPRLDPAALPGAVAAPFPASVTPMLAVPADAPPESSGKPGRLGKDDWLYEIKWDGMRVVLFLDQGTGKEPRQEKVRLLTRRGNDCSRQFPELTAAHRSFTAEQAVVDGEVVVLDERGRPSFPLLQPRIMAADAGAIANLVRTRPVVYCVFDLLYLDGCDLRAVPLVERKRALETILLPGPRTNSPVRFSEHVIGDTGGSGPSTGKDFLAAARAQELEGIVAKRAASRYESRRSADWVKIKIATQQEFVICGFTEGARDTFAALVLGLYEDGRLATVGSVGTGFDEPMLRALAGRLQLLVTSRSPFPGPIKLSKPAPITWVRPELVCTVRFNSWTPDGRLRAPVFLGLRPDIDPAECVRGGAGDSPTESPQLPKSSFGADEAVGVDSQNAPSGSKRKGTASAVPHKTRKAGASAPEVRHSAAPRATRLLPDAGSTVSVDVDGRQLKFTNLNKVFYPQEGYTKRDLIRYYDAVSPLLLPYLQDRPLSLRRYPDGIEGESFFQKHARTDFPSWLRTETIEMDDGKKPTRFVVADDRPSLLYLANLACIDQNPWMSRVPNQSRERERPGKVLAPDSLEHPDFILIDLDPQDCPYDRIVEAAQLIRQKLDLLELEGYPKTTGGHGMHIYVPVEPVYTYEQTRTFAEILARWVAEERPDLFTTPRPVARREKGKVYFDYLQNGYGKTISAPYVLRAHPGAPVATPLAWHEVTPGLVPTRFHIRNALDRFANVGDLFRPVLDSPQRMEPALEKLAVVMKPQ